MRKEKWLGVAELIYINTVPCRSVTYRDAQFALAVAEWRQMARQMGSTSSESEEKKNGGKEKSEAVRLAE